MKRLLAIIYRLLLRERKCPTCTHAEELLDRPGKFNCHIQSRVSYVAKGYFVCGSYERG